MYHLRDIANPDNNYSYAQKCEKIKIMIRETFYNFQTHISYLSEMTILNLIDWIIKISFNSADQYIISEIEDIQINMSFISNWIKDLKIHLLSCLLPNSAIYVYCIVIDRITLDINAIYQSLTQRIEALRPLHQPTGNNIPTYLETKESLDICPDLKDKLASSTKILMDVTANVLCSICIDEAISKQENFAILDKCVHLFCRPCIRQWFKTA